MNDKREKTPWWLLYLSPSIIPMLPFIVIPLCGVLIAVLLPLVEGKGGQASKARAGKGTFYSLTRVLGRPRGRSVDSRPS